MRWGGARGRFYEFICHTLCLMTSCVLCSLPMCSWVVSFGRRCVGAARATHPAKAIAGLSGDILVVVYAGAQALTVLQQ